MTVTKFGSFEDARRALWVPAGDLSLASRVRNLWSFSSRIAEVSAPAGVQKFRSIEEANDEREERVKRRVDELRRSHRRRDRPPNRPAD
ncbi:MAG: hypothetical protein IH849_03730 [Acidobacteria bacterium]|nr:hypothetical protein [Acidobacteriota bacterium]